VSERLQMTKDAGRREASPSRCACGGIVGPEGECAACKARQLRQSRPGAAHEGPGHAFSELRVDADRGAPGSIRGPLLQRQPDAARPPWDSSLLTITLSSDRGDCFGIATPTVLDPYSACGSPVVPPFCQSARIPFWLDYLVDRAGRSHPQPGVARTVTADFGFTTTGGRVTYSRHEKDDNPRYVGPNLALEPKFGHDFTFGTTESGRLTTAATLVDGATTVGYHDAIDFHITPCT